MSQNACATIAGNTGAPDCIKQRGVPKRPLIGSRAFTWEEYNDPAIFRDAIIASTLLETGDSDKLYAFPEVLQVDPKTEADTEGNLTLGPKVRLRKGRPAYTYTVDISHAEYQRLLVFDGQKVPVFTLDDENAFWAYRQTTTRNTLNKKNMTGEMAYVTVSGYGFKDGANVGTGKAQITISYISIDDFEKRSVYAFMPDLSSGDLVGLIDVMPYETSVHTTNVYHIGLAIPSPQVDAEFEIIEDYGTELAALTWTAGTGAKFATPLTVTSVAVVAGALNFTFDSTAHTALATDTEIRIFPPSVADISEGNVGTDKIKYEIGFITVVKTA